MQVVSLKKKPQSEGSSFQAQAAAPQVHPHLTSAAMRAQAQAAQPLPTAKVCALQHRNVLPFLKMPDWQRIICPVLWRDPLCTCHSHL